MKRIVLNTIKKTTNYKIYNVLVDDNDFLRINQYNWTVRKGKNNLYAYTRIKGKLVYMHSFVMGFKGIDHINGNGLDNQKLNLRKATHQQNNWNRKPYEGTSKFKGVSWDRHRRKWLSQIEHNRKKVNIGRFNNEVNAAMAYNFVAEKLFGPFARMN